MNAFYRILGERLQPLDVENLKFLLANNFKGKFHWTFAFVTQLFSRHNLKYQLKLQPGSPGVTFWTDVIFSKLNFIKNLMNLI